MKGLGSVSRAIAIATLVCFAAPQAEAIEAYGTGIASQGDNGLLVQVRGGRGGGMHRRAAACIAAGACIGAARMA